MHILKHQDFAVLLFSVSLLAFLFLSYLILDLICNLKHLIHTANAYYQHNNLQHISRLRESYIIRLATRGETREILIINSMKLWQIEIKLQSNRFSRAIVRFRWTRCSRARVPLHVRVYVIRQDQYPGDITLVISKRNCERGWIGEFGFYVTMDW